MYYWAKYKIIMGYNVYLSYYMFIVLNYILNDSHYPQGSKFHDA